MKYITKLKLAAVHQLCDAEDKSTEYMMQLMQDTCGCDLDTATAYMLLPTEEKERLIKDVNSFVHFFNRLCPSD